MVLGPAVLGTRDPICETTESAGCVATRGAVRRGGHGGCGVSQRSVLVPLFRRFHRTSAANAAKRVD
jgi:hypothetical protein